MIFVRGCIIEANKNDSHNDILTKEDIKKINRNLGDIQFDTQHNREQFHGCRVIENTVYDDPITIDNKTLNSGSWVITLEVDNPSVEQQISDGELQGFSLFSYAGGKTSYNEVMDKSDVYPIFLSFVKDPANQVPFEVLSENEYISKSENIMADDNKILDKIREMLSAAEEPQEVSVDEKAIQKEEGSEPAKVEEGVKMETQGKPIAKEEEEVKEEEASVSKEAKSEDDAISKECKSEDGAVSKAAVEPEVSNAEIKELLLKVIALLEADIAEECEEEVEAVVKEDVEVPVAPKVEEEAVAEKQYIVKQATQKNVEVVEPVVESSPRFDLFGRKL